MSKISIVAQRYAAVLVELAEDNETLLQWEGELHSLVSALEDEKSKSFFYSDAIEPEVKTELLERVNDQIGFSEKIYNLLRVLIDKRNLSILPEIQIKFSEKVDHLVGREKFTIKTAYPIDDKSKNQIEEKVATFTDHLPNLVYEYTVDESILGGFIAQSDSILIDGSTKTHLSKLRKKLLQR